MSRMWDDGEWRDEILPVVRQAYEGDLPVVRLGVDARHEILRELRD